MDKSNAPNCYSYNNIQIEVASSPGPLQGRKGLAHNVCTCVKKKKKHSINCFNMWSQLCWKIYSKYRPAERPASKFAPLVSLCQANCSTYRWKFKHENQRYITWLDQEPEQTNPGWGRSTNLIIRTFTWNDWVPCFRALSFVVTLWKVRAGRG